MSLFFVIYLAPGEVRTLIDGIRVIADPLQKYHAHITVRGPYNSNSNIKKNNYSSWSKKISEEEIYVDGVGTFLEQKQSTVFFRCKGNGSLKKVWYKRDYKEFNPHITIYDRSNRKFASDLYLILNNYHIYFHINTGDLTKISSYSRDTLEFSNYPKLVSKKLDYERLTEILGTPLTSSDVINMNDNKRLKYIGLLADYLEKNCSEKKRVTLYSKNEVPYKIALSNDFV